MLAYVHLWTTRLTAAGLATTAGLAAGVGAPAAWALDPVNPVTVPLDGHPANSGFLVFVEGDATLNSDEAEGTMAAGGDLTLLQNYNIAAGAAPVMPTFTAPGDDAQTYLYVGGGVQWGPNPLNVFVENMGYTKIADTSTYDAFNTDQNDATVNYRIVPEGEPYLTDRFIEGRTPDQTPASIGTPVPSDLIDIPGAFALYRDLTQQMAACPATVTLTDTDGEPLPRPVGPGTSGRVTLEPDQTNVLTVTTEELANLSEITFTNQPSQTQPLLINVTGDAFTGEMPNLAGVGPAEASSMLWNFPDATNINVTGGDTIEGTIYAPNAALTWETTQNIEGNIIAAEFVHGMPAQLDALAEPQPLEVHDFPFQAMLSCEPTAELTLEKVVVNDDGGTAEPGDWTLTADGADMVTGTSDTPDVTDVSIEPGDYVLSEDGPDGYETDGWVCDGGTLDGDTLTLAEADDITCTITNDDIPAEPTPSPTPSPTLGPTPGPPTLPESGGSILPWLLAAMGGVGAGLALMRLAHRLRLPAQNR